MHFQVVEITLDVALAPICSFVPINIYSVDSGIDIGQGITIGSGNICKTNTHRALNKLWAGNKMCKLLLKKSNTKPLEKISRCNKRSLQLGHWA